MEMKRLYEAYMWCFLVLAVINALLFAWSVQPYFLGFTISSLLGAFVTGWVGKWWKE